jgi:tRNA(Leu) C34 or U34 (ribose-2'-O)-methylase TrmL
VSALQAASRDSETRKASFAMPGPTKARGYAAIGLANPKNGLNVGSVLRAAGCYGAAMVAVSGARPGRFLGRLATDTQKAYRHMPLITCEDMHSAIPFDCVPVAVELLDGAKSLFEYTHPERAFYVFGPEDGTLGKAITSWCRDVVYIPTSYCMNLAATVNVVLYDRAMKRRQ